MSESSSPLRVGCVLMAAGFGRRFGGNKLLTRTDGVPLYERAMEVLSPVPFARRVVVSQYPEVLRAGPSRGFAPIWNAAAGEGIAATVRLGTAALEGLDGALFAVCDQPFLTTESILNLLQSFMQSPTHIHALSWHGQRGNPVLFPASCFSELRALTGDRGGGKVAARHPEQVVLVEAASPQELRDIDCPEDLMQTPDYGKEPRL